MQRANVFVSINTVIGWKNSFDKGKKLSKILEQEAKFGTTNNFESVDEIQRNSRFLQNPNFVEFISCFFQSTHLHHKRQQYVESFQLMEKSVKNFLKKVYQSDKSNWMLPVMRVLCLYVRLFAFKAYNYRKKNKLQYEKNEETELSIAVNCLYSVNRISVSQKTDNPKESKKSIVLHLGNQLFKIYFKLKNLTATKQLIMNIDNVINTSPGGEEAFVLCDRVTWNYYSGIIAIFDNEFKKAEKKLQFSFSRCPRNMLRNKQRILRKLICVRLVLGKVPSNRLLNLYRLDKYQEIVVAFRSANMKEFDASLNKHYKFLFLEGTYIILHRCRTLIFRSFFKKCIKFRAKALNNPKLETRIPIDKLNKYVKKFLPQDQEYNETECILSSLIYSGYIRGYISHKKKMLVVASIKNAFPKIENQYKKD